MAIIQHQKVNSSIIELIEEKWIYNQQNIMKKNPGSVLWRGNRTTSISEK